MPILTCCMESRSRTVTAWSLSESKFTGDAERGADLVLPPVPAADRAGVVVAVGRSILVIAWHLLSDPGARFTGLGPGFYATGIDPERPKRGHIRPVEALGYKVTLQPAA